MYDASLFVNSTGVMATMGRRLNKFGLDAPYTSCNAELTNRARLRDFTKSRVFTASSTAS